MLFRSRYPRMEKLALALVTVARKLKPYFQAHIIVVLTDQPLKKAISSPEAAGKKKKVIHAIGTSYKFYYCEGFSQFAPIPMGLVCDQML